jgi:RNA polymerase sigma-70 factor (ECF subfamily)
VAETEIQGDAALVKCDDPQKLDGMYLVLFFVKSADGWKNWYLHNAPPTKPLQDFWKQVPTSTNAAGQEQGQTWEDLPPVIVETQPVSGERDVTPGTVEIWARFSKEMTDTSWSWAAAWLNSAPEIIGQPRFESDHRTCVAKMKLEPGRTYAIWLNSENYHNFKDLAGQPAVPYLMIFQTKSN